MTVEAFRRGDTADFLALAAGEGWVAEAWEFEFLLGVFPEGCFCQRDSAGRGIAFVTSIRHERDGWIGNLIVAEGYRGRGIGERLFLSALAALKGTGVRTVWLTASDSGRSLYEKHGFRGVDTIVRWSGSGRQRRPDRSSRPGAGQPLDPDCCRADGLVWGDRRETLLAAVAGRGRAVREDGGFAVLQPCGSATQIGPYSATDSGSAARLLDTALASVPGGTRVYLDAPLSNRSAVRLFSRRGMRVTGSTVLMCAGERPAYRPENLYGLATMGSCG